MVGMALTMAHAVTPTYRGGLAINYHGRESLTARDVVRGRGDVRIGDVVIWQHGEGIRGHVGIVERVVDRWTIVTIEANTSPGPHGSQDDGDGIWRRLRRIELYNFFRIRWFTHVSYA